MPHRFRNKEHAFLLQLLRKRAVQYLRGHHAIDHDLQLRGFTVDFRDYYSGGVVGDDPRGGAVCVPEDLLL